MTELPSGFRGRIHRGTQQIGGKALARGRCRVKFAEWTSKGELRQPVYLGLRTDKQAKDVVREQERPQKSARLLR